MILPLFFHKATNRLLKFFQIRRIRTTEKVVYLTFDDGPEPEICEFVLDCLQQYGYRATFFCTGKNAEQYPELMQQLRDKGHVIANHSYSHVCPPYDSRTEDYVADVNHANEVLHSPLFRPPWGSVSLSKFIRLAFQYRFVSWSLGSEDNVKRSPDYDWESHVQEMMKRTSPGEVVLFHFAQKHHPETVRLLPRYLQLLHEQGWKSEALPLR